MFCIRLWSNFGVFRDPLTITQNLTFPIPPKTTIGGMLASILGIDYNDYFSDPEYFNFAYSLVLLKPIFKKSFTQNYVADYTKNSETKISTIAKYCKINDKYNTLTSEKAKLENQSDFTKKEKKNLEGIDKKIEAAQKGKQKGLKNCEEVFNNSFRSPKPIFRELILSPEFLVFVKNYKHEKKIVSYLRNHYSEFSLYMGNSEFAANYEYVESESRLIDSNRVNSLTAQLSKIYFEPGKRYTNLYMATKTVGKREYRDYRNIVICDKPIKFNQTVQIHSIRTDKGTYECDFV